MKYYKGFLYLVLFVMGLTVLVGCKDNKNDYENQYIKNIEFNNDSELIVEYLNGKTKILIGLDSSKTVKSAVLNDKGEVEVRYADDSFKNLGVNPEYFLVQFKDYNGYVIDVQNVLKGESARKPNDPVRDGYDFLGWDRTYDEIYTNLEVYAKYSDEPELGYYSVQFKDHNGYLLDFQYVLHGKSAVTPRDPSREGYVFVKWDIDYFNVLSDLVIKPIYIRKTYNVEFESNGGSKVDEVNKIQHGSVIYLEEPIKSGYIFIGWFSDKQFSNEFTDETEVYKDLKLYAKWEVTEDFKNILEVKELLESYFQGNDRYQNDFTLLTKFVGNVSGVWESLDSEYVEILQETNAENAVVKIKRPQYEQGNKEVIIRVKLTYGDLSDYWETKIVIIKHEEIHGSYNSFKTVFDKVISKEIILDSSFKSKPIEFKGVNLYKKTTSGSYLVTEDGTLAYIYGLDHGLEINKTYNIVAKVYNYFGELQLTDILQMNEVNRVNYEVKYAETTFEEINNLPIGLEGGMVASPTFKLRNVKMVMLTGISDQKYNLVIVPEEYNLDSNNKEYNGSILINYASLDYEKLRSLIDKPIDEINFVYKEHRNDKFVRSVTVFLVDDIIFKN